MTLLRTRLATRPGGPECGAARRRFRSGDRRPRFAPAIAFGDDPDSPATDQLARVALAAIDGAFVASQADSAVGLEQLLAPLAPALVAAAGLAGARAGASGPLTSGPAPGLGRVHDLGWAPGLGSGE